MENLTNNLENKQRRASFNVEKYKKEENYTEVLYWQGYQVCAQEIELGILRGDIKLK